MQNSAPGTVSGPLPLTSVLLAEVRELLVVSRIRGPSDAVKYSLPFHWLVPCVMHRDFLLKLILD